MKSIPAAIALLSFSLAITACEAPPVDRTGRLLAMAGEEAGGISNSLDRFTRQLNIADTQLRTQRKADADKTLALARDTLKGAKKEEFDDFHRIAAWTAISQLARGADDKDMALKASDQAQAALNDVQPPAERPQYVQSLAWELAELRGKPAAIELLESGSAWAAEIKDSNVRRYALLTFAEQLLSYDAFDNARNTLRRDPDASWRTDAFLALANQNTYYMEAGYARLGGIPGATGAASGGRGGAAGAGTNPSVGSLSQQAQTANFNKDVRFENAFKQGR